MTTQLIVKAAVSGALIGLAVSAVENAYYTHKARKAREETELLERVADYAEAVARRVAQKEIGIERLSAELLQETRELNAKMAPVPTLEGE